MIFAADVAGAFAVTIIGLLTVVVVLVVVAWALLAANGAILDLAIIASIRSRTMHSDFPYAFCRSRGSSAPSGPPARRALASTTGGQGGILSPSSRSAITGWRGGRVSWGCSLTLGAVIHAGDDLAPESQAGEQNQQHGAERTRSATAAAIAAAAR